MTILKNFPAAILIIFLLANCSYSYPAGKNLAADSEYSGNWEGSLNVGGGNSFRLVFHIIQKSDSLSATLDSPDQGAFGIPVSSIIASEDSLRLNVKTINGYYLAKFEKENLKLTGTWSQNGMSFPLDLTKKPSTEEKK